MKITRRKLRKLLLREIRLLNEAGMEETAFQIEETIVAFLERSRYNARNLDDVISGTYRHFVGPTNDYLFSNIAEYKEAVIDLLDYSFELEYDVANDVVSIKREFIDMGGY